MEFVNGTKVSEKEKLKELGFSLAEVRILLRIQFHESVLARTVLNAGNFLWRAKKGNICDVSFHYTLDQPLVKW